MSFYFKFKLTTSSRAPTVFQPYAQFLSPLCLGKLLLRETGLDVPETRVRIQNDPNTAIPDGQTPVKTSFFVDPDLGNVKRY